MSANELNEALADQQADDREREQADRDARDGERVLNRLGLVVCGTLAVLSTVMLSATATAGMSDTSDRVLFFIHLAGAVLNGAIFTLSARAAFTGCNECKR